MGAERLNYSDQSFDVAVGFAIIHHLDLSLAIPELYRVLSLAAWPILPSHWEEIL